MPARRRPMSIIRPPKMRFKRASTFRMAQQKRTRGPQSFQHRALTANAACCAPAIRECPPFPAPAMRPVAFAERPPPRPSLEFDEFAPPFIPCSNPLRRRVLDVAQIQQRLLPRSRFPHSAAADTVHQRTLLELFPPPSLLHRQRQRPQYAPVIAASRVPPSACNTIASPISSATQLLPGQAATHCANRLTLAILRTSVNLCPSKYPSASVAT